MTISPDSQAATHTRLPRACSVFGPDGRPDWTAINKYNSVIRAAMKNDVPGVNESNLFTSLTGDLGSVATCLFREDCGDRDGKVSTLLGRPSCAALGAAAASEAISPVAIPVQRADEL